MKATEGSMRKQEKVLVGSLWEGEVRLKGVEDICADVKTCLCWGVGLKRGKLVLQGEKMTELGQ